MNFYPLTTHHSPLTTHSPLLIHTEFKDNQAGDRTIMLGTFQKSLLRIELEAAETAIRDSLLRPMQLQQWLWFERLTAGMPEQLHQGLTYTGWVGPVAIQHQVQVVTPVCLRLLLWGGIDGFHEWYWGEGWVQSRLEGISILPLNLGQTLSLLGLRQFLATQKE